MQNKTSKYIKYAIGEIVLVVFGILIALGINSAYNASQNEAKIKTILTQVQQDLMTDIVDAKRIFNTHIEKDSLFEKIMNDSITFEMYIKNPYQLPITTNYVSFSNKKGGYNRYMNNLENLPEKYNVLLPHFNNLYVEMQNDIDDYNSHIKNTVMVDGRKKEMANPKSADYQYGRYPEEAMEFYFKDPYLKNMSAKYINDLRNISKAANDYRIESIVLYKKIDSLLGRTPTAYTEPLTTLPEKENIIPFLGDYTGKSSVLGETLSLIITNEQLVLKSSDYPDTKLYWHQDNYYFMNLFGTIFRIYKNKQGQDIIEIRYNGKTYKFIKTKGL
jgi:hypothetical protein